MRTSTARALLLGTLVVGTLDALDAIVFFGLRSGATPPGIFRGIAAGLLGPSARSGGLSTALLGVALHYLIAFLIVATFFLASRHLSILRRAPVPAGLLYGIVAYLVMNYVVLPASAIGRGGLGWPPVINAVVINGMLIHMFGVGLPSSLFASASRRP